MAYMPTETAGIFLRIKPQFWHEPRSDMRINGMLFDLDKGDLVPDEIDEQTFCVFEECARSWLAGRRIDEDNLRFPDALRIGGPIKANSQPNDEQIIAEAQRKISEENPALPEALRTPKSIIGSRKKSGRPPSAIKKWCVNTGLIILSERGGMSPNFRQVHLINEIYKRRPKHWVDEEPSEASMKRYARQVIEQFTDAKG